MSESVSTYQDYLPTIFQNDIFLGKFLLAFEKILSGKDATYSQSQIITDNTQETPGLEEIIDNIHLYFNSQQTPEEFLPWLAGWVALSLRENWAIDVKKNFIQQMVGLYRLRGTKAGLVKILEIYLEYTGFPKKVEVNDEFLKYPNYFQVRLDLKEVSYENYSRMTAIAKAIIDREKPAHTFYALKIKCDSLKSERESEGVRER